MKIIKTLFTLVHGLTVTSLQEKSVPGFSGSETAMEPVIFPSTASLHLMRLFHLFSFSLSRISNILLLFISRAIQPVHLSAQKLLTLQIRYFFWFLFCFNIWISIVLTFLTLFFRRHLGNMRKGFQKPFIVMMLLHAKVRLERL